MGSRRAGSPIAGGTALLGECELGNADCVGGHVGPTYLVENRPVIHSAAMTPRVVTCPHCTKPRETRAARRTTLRCEGCGRHFRVPATDPTAPAVPARRRTRAAATPVDAPVVEVPPPVPVPAPSPVPPLTPSSPGPAGVTVEVASSTKVRRAARPRPPRDAPAPPAPPFIPEPPAGQERARVKGRLGGSRGLGTYRRLVGRG